MISILKIGFLFLGIMFTISNIGLVKYKSDVPALNVIYQAIGITGFLVLQFNLL